MAFEQYYTDLKEWQDLAGHAAEAGGKVPQRSQASRNRRHMARTVPVLQWQDRSRRSVRYSRSNPVPGNQQQRGRPDLRVAYGSFGTGLA